MNTPLRRSGMAHVLKRSHSFTCTPRIHPLVERTIPATSGILLIPRQMCQHAHKIVCSTNSSYLLTSVLLISLLPEAEVVHLQ